MRRSPCLRARIKYYPSFWSSSSRSAFGQFDDDAAQRLVNDPHNRRIFPDFRIVDKIVSVFVERCSEKRAALWTNASPPLYGRFEDGFEEDMNQDHFGLAGPMSMRMNGTDGKGQQALTEAHVRSSAKSLRHTPTHWGLLFFT